MSQNGQSALPAPTAAAGELLREVVGMCSLDTPCDVKPNAFESAAAALFVAVARLAAAVESGAASSAAEAHAQQRVDLARLQRAPRDAEWLHAAVRLLVEARAGDLAPR